jgi:hypothetical protein
MLAGDKMTSKPRAVKWDIRNKGRAWKAEEAFPRYEMTPEKLEMVGGKLLDGNNEREILLCLLMENVGADRVVQFGDPEVWRSAVTKLKAKH